MSGYYNKNQNYKKKTTNSKAGAGGVCSNPVFGKKKYIANIPKMCTVVLSFVLHYLR